MNMRVSGKGTPEELREKVHKLAGAIAGNYRRGESPVLVAVAANAVNLAVKAIAVSSDFLQRTMWFWTEIVDVNIDGRKKAALKFHVEAVSADFLSLITATSVQRCPITNAPETGPITGLIVACFQGNCNAVDLSCIGAGVVYRATKAVQHATTTSRQLRVIPSFEDTEIDGEEKTRIVLRVCRIR